MGLWEITNDCDFSKTSKKRPLRPRLLAKAEKVFVIKEGGHTTH